MRLPKTERQVDMTRSRFERQLVNPIEDIKFFGAHPMEQQRLKWSTDPAERALYESLKADWKSLPNGPALTPQEKLREVRRNWDEQAKPRNYSPEELLAKGRWSEAAVVAMSAADALKLKKADARAYYELELARSSYSLPSSRSVEENRERVINATRIPDTTLAPQDFLVNYEMVEKLGFKSGERISLESFNAACSTLVRLEDEERARSVSEAARRIIEQEDAAKGAE